MKSLSALILPFFLFRIVKLWAKQRGVSDTFKGGLSNFTLVLLSTYFWFTFTGKNVNKLRDDKNYTKVDRVHRLDDLMPQILTEFFRKLSTEWKRPGMGSRIE